MMPLTRFSLLIEPQRVRALLGTTTAMCALLGLLGGNAAHAQALSPKIAPDLAGVVNAATTPSLSWAKDVDGVRYVKALVVSDSADPNLANLRAAVLSA